MENYKGPRHYAAMKNNPRPPLAKMSFDEAKAVTMPFGKHKDKTLDDVASTDDGLKYLDWLRGQRGVRDTRLDLALAAYLDNPTIQRDLSALIGGAK